MNGANNATEVTMQNRKLEGFLGMWQLVPERSVYSAGGPPKQATYVISGHQQELVFTIAWVDQRSLAALSTPRR